MAKIRDLSLEDLVALQNKISEQVASCTSLEQAAQKYMTILYESLSESIVLARLFATVPFKDIPASNQKIIRDLAQQGPSKETVTEQTLILSLLGTKGAKAEWNAWQNSKGHIGIPLSSSDFIDKIPMISRLLKELGAGIDWIDSNDTALVLRTVGNISGIFYVPDAKTEVDKAGRKIISAQDFVEEEKIKTVFGIGGCYLGSSLFFAVIIFLREYVDREMAKRFVLQANKFKTATLEIATEGIFFS